MDSLRTKTLLYAEDNLVTQLLYKDYFSNFFKKVIVAENGQQALAFYHSEKPDLIILDINMPILNGLELSKIIREHDSNTKIILLTARTDKEAMIDAMDLGLIAYLEKPVSEARFAEILQKTEDEFNKTEKLKLWYYNKEHYSWDRQKRELFYANAPILLSPKEQSLLSALLISKQERLTYQQIYEIVWFEKEGENYTESEIKNLFNSLQAKLPPNALKSIYGIQLNFE